MCPPRGQKCTFQGHCKLQLDNYQYTPLPASHDRRLLLTFQEFKASRLHSPALECECAREGCILSIYRISVDLGGAWNCHSTVGAQSDSGQQLGFWRSSPVYLHHLNQPVSFVHVSANRGTLTK